MKKTPFANKHVSRTEQRYSDDTAQYPSAFGKGVDCLARDNNHLATPPLF
jgi:hypothetical protein